MPSLHTAARPGAKSDALDAVVPTEVCRPESVADLVSVVRAAARAGKNVVPHGNRSKIGWAAPTGPADLALDLTGLDSIVDHAAGDLIVVAQAGVRLADLQQRVGHAEQMLALDPAEPQATLGGVVSANASGPRRLRYGTARDLLIGITVVLPDGTLASAGGRVVKNVAGYDLGKLFVGAHGSLGVVVSTTWRLHPRPAAAAVVTLDIECADAALVARTLAHSPLTPVAIELRGHAGGRGALQVLFESSAESVTAQADATTALLGGGNVSAAVPADFGARPHRDDRLAVRIAHPPKALPAVLAALPAGTEVRASARVGIVEAVLADGPAVLDSLRRQLAAVAANAVVFATPASWRGRVDHWGPIGDTLPLMRRVKDEFDPEHRFAPGRFVGGI